MSRAPDSLVCHNCDSPLAGAFCAGCGQKAQALNPSLHDLAHDVTHEMLHVDGRIFQSVRRLLTSPGFLSREHFQGRRARWISPLRLYLVFSVLYFAVASFGGRAVVTGATDQETIAELQRRGFQSEAELQAAVDRAQAVWIPRAMFVLVPVFGGLVSLAAGRARLHYPLHLYFALHVHAAWFGAAACAALLAKPGGDRLQDGLNAAVGVYALVYLVLALRTAYGFRTRQAVLRGLAIGTAYYIIVLLVILAVILPVIFRPSV